jgi:hypothetical protein
MTTPLASVDQLEDRLGDVDIDEARIAACLADASALVRAEARPTWLDDAGDLALLQRLAHAGQVDEDHVAERLLRMQRDADDCGLVVFDVDQFVVGGELGGHAWGSSSGTGVLDGIQRWLSGDKGGV